MPKRKSKGGNPAAKSTVPSPRPPPTEYPHSSGTCIVDNMARMASVSAGVAVGSAVGHRMGEAIVGGHRSDRTDPAPYTVANDQQFRQLGAENCQTELRKLLECSQMEANLSRCNVYNEELKECQRKGRRNI